MNIDNLEKWWAGEVSGYIEWWWGVIISIEVNAISTMSLKREVLIVCESIRLNYNIFVGSNMVQFTTKTSFALLTQQKTKKRDNSCFIIIFLSGLWPNFQQNYHLGYQPIRKQRKEIIRVSSLCCYPTQKSRLPLQMEFSFPASLFSPLFCFSKPWCKKLQ